MTKGKPRDRPKEQQWRRWIETWRASRPTVRAFCARYRLAQARFYAWRRELQRRNAEQPTFVPVCVVADDVSAREECVDVVRRGGRTVRVGPGFDAATLRPVAAVLEEGLSC
jgi:hypothetical protein